ncbi:MAG: type IV toxin-antitoxin system AbiEi family antitoxin domain-containing protein [Bacilli bacterium]|nr:type IV toxin-antitoxin system AbiEi family antitoxin domain-containing protein [Bacilli bacterium]
MELNENVLDFLKNNNIITTRQFVNLGLSNTTLSNYVKNGLLEKCSHGIYTLPDSLYDDIYVFMLCSDKIIFSHEMHSFLMVYLIEHHLFTQ